MLATPANTAEAKTVASLLTSLIKSTYHHHQMMVAQQQAASFPAGPAPSMSSSSPQQFMQSCTKAFEAPRPPSIPLEDYVQRIYKYSGVSFEVLVCALMYIDRIVLMNPTFLVTDRNVHRLFLACVVLAVKTYEDAFYNNAFYANVGGVPVGEMNKLEIAFLTLIRFELFVDHAAYQQYHTAVASMKAFSYAANIPSTPASPTHTPHSPPHCQSPNLQQQQQQQCTYEYYYGACQQAPATSASSPPPPLGKTAPAPNGNGSVTIAATSQCRFRAHANVLPQQHQRCTASKDNIIVMA